MIVKKTKKYRIEAEGGLIDNCKYMLYLSAGWTLAGGEDCMPCKSIREAMEYVKEATFECKHMEELAEIDFTAWIGLFESDLDHSEYTETELDVYYNRISELISEHLNFIENKAFKKCIKKK